MKGKQNLKLIKLLIYVKTKFVFVNENIEHDLIKVRRPFVLFLISKQPNKSSLDTQY